MATDFDFTAAAAALTKHKDEGNEHFKAGNYIAAAECYSKGLAEAAGNPDARHAFWNCQGLGMHIVAYEDVLNILRNNRAACFLKLGRYLEAAEDAHIAAESVKGMWLMGFNSSPADAHHFRRIGKGDDIHLKGRMRAARAFAGMGNSARALEELEWLEVHKASAAAMSLDAHVPMVPHDVAADLRRLRLCRHPDLQTVKTAKLDWRGCVAGTWKAVYTKGKSPLPLNGATAAYHRGKVFVFGGLNPNTFQHNSMMWVLELSTYTWRKGGMMGLSAADAKGVSPEQSASVVWEGKAYFYQGGTRVLQHDMSAEVWQVRQSVWLQEGLKDVAFHKKGDEGLLNGFAAVAARGKMYLYGGSLRGKHTTLNHLVALDLTTFTWEVLSDSAVINAGVPERRYCHTMWEGGGKLWMFGGRVHRSGWVESQPASDDCTFNQDRYLYSWDLDSSTWANEGRMAPGHSTGNAPCGRSEVASVVATKKDGTPLAVVFGGITTFLKHQPDPKNNQVMHGFQFLADTFIFDTATCCWKCVHCDAWPPHRAGACMVYVPDDPLTGSSSAMNGSSSHGAESSHKRSKGWVPGRLLMIGGYVGGNTCLFGGSIPDLSDSTVWELRLERRPKHVKVVCDACGKYDVGMKQCTGSCGGALVVCSPECHKASWDGGHKLWCKKVPIPSKQRTTAANGINCNEEHSHANASSSPRDGSAGSASALQAKD